MDEDIISEILEEDEVSERELLEELAREEKLQQEQMLANPPEAQAMALSPFQETIVSTGSGVAYAILLVPKEISRNKIKIPNNIFSYQSARSTQGPKL